MENAEKGIHKSCKCTGGNRLLIVGIIVCISTTMIMAGLFISVKLKSEEKG